MSIPVSLADLPGQVELFGPHAYLLTVTEQKTPRANSVMLSWEGPALVGGAGRHTAASVAENDQVAILWPANAQGHALIVDGWADIRATADGNQVVVQPAKAILHITGRGRAH